MNRFVITGTIISPIQSDKRGSLSVKSFTLEGEREYKQRTPNQYSVEFTGNLVAEVPERDRDGNVIDYFGAKVLVVGHIVGVKSPTLTPNGKEFYFHNLKGDRLVLISTQKMGMSWEEANGIERKESLEAEAIDNELPF